MIQVILGKSIYDGFIQSSFITHIDDMSMDAISDAIIDGCHQSSALFTDTSVFTGLETNKLSTYMDLLCLQYLTRQQGVEIIVTDVDNIPSDSSYLLKVISPTLNGINHSVDYAYDPNLSPISITDVASTISDTMDLFNPNIFLDNPISSILNTLPSLESSNIPTNNSSNAISSILTDLGFKLIVVDLSQDD